jgi:hypothetical protein
MLCCEAESKGKSQGKLRGRTLSVSYSVGDEPKL